MFNKKKKLLTIIIVAVILVILAFGLFVDKSRQLFHDYHDIQLNNYSNLMKKTIEIANVYTELADQMVAEDLYHKILTIDEDLEGIGLEEISAKLLEDIKNKNQVTDLAILAQDKEGFYIHSSTVKEEIGQRTTDWGYWNIAFEQLFAGEEVDIDKGQKGQSSSNYWLGPRSKSHFEEGYFRYAYYYQEEGNLLINMIIKEENIYQENLENLLGDFFEHLYKDISYVEAASLIDLNAWEKAYHNNFKNPESAAYLYGSFGGKKLMVESRISPDQLKAIEQSQSFELIYNGEEKSLFMIKVGKENPQIIVLLVNDQEANFFIKDSLRKVVALQIFTILVSVASISILVMEYRNLLTLQIKRNNEIERFSKNVAMIPEITYKCKMIDQKVHITFISGKGQVEEDEISLDTLYYPLDTIYRADYVSKFEEEIKPVFEGQTKKFEITQQDVHYEHFVSPIVDDEGKIHEIIGIANNVTSRKIEEEQAKYQASHDFLTGLLNRRAFEETTNQKLQENPHRNYAIMVMDLDGFKKVNDSLGHLAGDQVLKKVSARLKVCAQRWEEEIILCRMGGDEFAILLPYEEKEILDKVAGKITETISMPYGIDKAEVQLGVSIGIALYSKHASSYNKLLYYADMAMYQAKKSGGKRYSFFRPGMEK